MKRVAVYCGSSSGHQDRYVPIAKRIGTLLAEQDLELVYGGGSVGLMGATADSMLASGGVVIGVIPEFLEARELGHKEATEMHVVRTMHERKQKMIDLADAFITLPGGLGTMEELFEVLAWNQLGLHTCPCGILNVDGYYDGLLQTLDRMVEDRLVRIEDRERLIASEDPDHLLELMRAWDPPTSLKWEL